MNPLSQMSWPFVHPALAAAAGVAAAVPIVIHLLNRQRYVRVPWGAMRFLRSAMKRSQRRVRVEQWLLLAVRAGLIAMLLLAAARPFFPMLPLASLGQTRTHRILLVDNSGSMRAAAVVGDRGGRETRFNRAMKAAETLLGSFPAGDAVSVVTMASPAKAVVGYPAYDRRLVRERLGEVEVTARGTDIAGGMSAARRIIDDARFAPDSAVVYVISDLPKRAFVGAGNSRSAGETIAAARQTANRVKRNGLVFVNVVDGGSSNLAVADVRVRQGEAVAGGALRPLRIEADVANYSSSAARGVELAVSIGDRIVRRTTVEPIEAGGIATVRLSAAAPSGSCVVKASIEASPSDVLAADDSRLAALEVVRELPILLVEGSGRGTHEVESGRASYLAAALAPGARAGDAGSIRAKTISSSDFAMEPTADYGVIVLCNVPRLDEADWPRLRQFVQSGGGLLIFGGDLVDIDHYNEHGFADGQGVLPGRIDGVKESPGDPASQTRLLAEAFKHPALADFAEHPESGLFLGRVSAYLSLSATAPGSEVLMRCADGGPALISSAIGHGRVMVMTTSPDMSWSNLPAKGDYVSLMVNIVAYLAPTRGLDRTLVAGATLQTKLDATETSLPLRVASPGGDIKDARLMPVAADPAEAGDAAAQSTRFAAQYGPVDEIGEYAMSIGDRRVVFGVNAAPEESDLRTMDEAALREALDRELTYVSSAEAVTAAGVRAETNELAGAVLYAALVLIVMESWMAARFGAYR